MPVAHSYRYPQQSELRAARASLACRLAGDRDVLFRGRVVHARRTALALRAVARVVASRFFVPSHTLALLADPIATVGRRALRFEGFSSCCSTYARLDLGEGAFTDVSERVHGTTNVDFGSAMLAALAAVRDEHDLLLSVGVDSVAVQVDAKQILEREVPLPERWIRGLGESQAILARMTKRFAVSGTQALRFLRALPRQAGTKLFVERSGAGLRRSARSSPGAVRVAGLERLNILEGLTPRAESLRVYADESGSSAWVLDFGDARLTLALTPERHRGFSGEGQLLEALATGDADHACRRVAAQLAWQDALDPQELAQRTELPRSSIDAALAALASRGLVGFDLERGTWFHRELPFDLEHIERQHPRLSNARRLVDEGAVSLDRTDEDASARVRSGGVMYEVRLAKSSEATCTCPHFAKERGARGPCKHILATRIALGQDIDEQGASGHGRA